MNTLEDLFKHELMDMYDAEKQVAGSLEKMIDLVEHAELQTVLKEHMALTKEQMVRLEKIAEALEITVESQPCAGMKGILTEAEELLKELKGDVLDAGIILSAQKVDHYEICTYGTLAAFAEELEYPEEVVKLLQESLEEEHEANDRLTEIALSEVNQVATA